MPVDESKIIHTDIPVRHTACTQVVHSDVIAVTH